MTRLTQTHVTRFAALALLASFALAGCGGGADTVPSQDTRTPTSAPTYNGPPPSTGDIQAFKVNLYDNIRGRCGSCHGVGGQTPNFARADDVNLAYQQALGVVNLQNPGQSLMVTKVAGGHNCWLADAGSCGEIMTTWISNWAAFTQSGGGRQINLVAPAAKDPGSSKRFPGTPPAEFNGVHQLLTTYCAACHRSDAGTAQSPYFASSNVAEAYAAARTKINLDNPAQSRLVVRLGTEFHNCWGDCGANATEMRTAIETMANAILPTQIDSNLVLSKALTLYEGTVASGGNRYDANVIAMYEFKTGSGNVAYDTSGVDPALDLTFSGNVTWVGGWGINIASGKAQGSTAASRKLYEQITRTGEYSIEAWVVPGNVTQEDARIISYSGSNTARNFTMGQTLYNYDFFARSSRTGANGTPQLSTADADEDLQAALQHVVMTFDPVNGRRIYVNAEFTGDADRSGGGTLSNWDDSFAFVLGNEVSNDRQWQGVFRLVAVHNRALTPSQIRQNFEVGVGQKYFLLFGVSHLVSVPQSYIMFEVAQYDSYAYLFTNPKFISLDANARPGSIRVQDMRIGINGAEPAIGQAYRTLDVTITDSQYTAAAGQALSSVGTIIGLEEGPETDEFFLCFRTFGSRSNVCSQDATPIAPTPVNQPRPSDIGVRTFEKMNATMAAVTGVSPTTAAVKATYDTIYQALPATESIEAFLASHQTAIAQLAIQYCDALVNDTTARATYFPGFNFNSNLSTSVERDLVINPLIDRVMGVGIGTQPDRNAVRSELDGLIQRLCTSSACGVGSRTETVVKAACAAAVGSGVILVN